MGAKVTKQAISLSLGMTDQGGRVHRNPTRLKFRDQKAKRLQRVLDMIRILESGRTPNSVELSEDLGVSRRTVFRDISMLRNTDFPILFDETTQRYCLSEKAGVPHMPEPIKVMDIAIALNFMRLQDGMASTVALAHQLITSRLNEEFARFLNLCLDIVHILPTGDINLIPPSERQLLYSLLTYRFDELKVRLQMRGGASTSLSPYEFCLTKNGWLVAGRSSLHCSNKSFALSAIESTSPTGDYFDPPCRLCNTNLFKDVRLAPLIRGNSSDVH